MKTKNAIDFPHTLRELYSHPEFHPWGSSSDDLLEDPERAARCRAAAAHGCDGSTHYERMNDWRDFLRRLTSDALRPLFSHDRIAAEIERREAAILEEINECEEWHDKNGSLHQEIG